ncbi:MAG: hypothetical protein KAI43_10715 [Candidatus Aureabacteria bacterium]|nr:hypothetical protein [Candidatus Auribacterota bacterium]
MGKYIFGLYLIGIIFILLEIYIPGGVLGIIGFVSLLLCVALSFTFGVNFGLLMSFITLVSLAAGVYFVIKYIPESPIGKKLFLTRTLKRDKDTEESFDRFIGKEGIAITDLRPSGTAKINNRRIDVVTEGDYIDKDKKISVIAVEGNRVIVREI